MRDPYECLGVPRTATADEISKSFRQLAKQIHPDVNDDPKAAELFTELSVAHEILSDEEKRRAFDRREIDAEGKPALPAVRARSTGMWPSVALAVAVLMLAAISTLIIQRLRPQPESAANIDTAVSRLPDNQDRAETGQIEKPDPASLKPRLVLQQNDSYATDNTIPLGLQVSGEADGLALEISGLPNGSTLSSGRAIGGGKWRILAADVGNAMISPPQGFRGALDFAVELRLADDRIVDSGSFRLEWTPTVAAAAVEPATARAIPDTSSSTATAGSSSTGRNASQPVAELDREQIELLIGRSQDLVTHGDFAAARTLLLRAAENRDARVALALGATFDPIMLGIVQAPGVAADLASARDWYKKAIDLGSLEAQQRLQLLASVGAGRGEPIAVTRVTVFRNPGWGIAAKDPTLTKRKNNVARQPSHDPASPSDPSGVYLAGERVGSDPDPKIRSQLLRDDAGRQSHMDSTNRRAVTDQAKPTTDSATPTIDTREHLD
jgi:curved DNA-binding protein CbpA